MKNSPFQMILLVVSVFVAIFGVVVFALFSGALKSSTGPVTIWGTVSSQAMQGVFNTLKVSDKAYDTVTYVQKDPASYQAELVNAIASGNPPDLIIMTQEDIAVLQNKVQVIPYASFSQSAFLSAYIDEGQLFLTGTGALALPFVVDPLEMYWNRDLFAAAGLANPPTYWSDLVTTAPLLTKSDAAGTIRQSAAGLGLWSNVNNAKELIATLFIQAGEPITSVQGGALTSLYGRGPNGSVPAESALRFYTDFANPSKTVYAWNHAMPGSRDAFISGTTALYFGFAGEYNGIVAGNPNIHVGVAMLPQVQGQSFTATYGRLYGLAIPRSAPNPTGALAIASSLTGTAGAVAVMTNLGLPSGRRDIGLDTRANAIQQVAQSSALVARGWLDPDPSTTAAIFQTMIESVVSGAQSPADAVGGVEQAFERLFVPQPK